MDTSFYVVLSPWPVSSLVTWGRYRVGEFRRLDPFPPAPSPLDAAQLNTRLQSTSALGLRISEISKGWTVKEGFVEEVAMRLEIRRR